MPRYIDAEKLIDYKFAYITHNRYVSDGKPKSEEEVYAYKVGYNEAVDNIIQFATTVDVREVKHGKWIKVGDNSYRCSVCDEVSCCMGNYCPDCGADMRQETEDA